MFGVQNQINSSIQVILISNGGKTYQINMFCLHFFDRSRF